MTKAKKLEYYKEILRRTKSYSSVYTGICGVMDRMPLLTDQESETLLKELYKYAPTVSFKKDKKFFEEAKDYFTVSEIKKGCGYWFESGRRAPRIEILQKAIKALEE